ncbi:MAG: hypothetical protein KDA58_05840, partial [Planctomycetaceae bacterium]|nr:hypothetical protein [Planctomycetaceae bacterium]
MNCREARTEIALLVGNDLEDASARELLRQHVSGCPECRQYYRQMKQSFKVLEQADKSETYETRESLWPAVSQRLKHRRPEAPSRRQWWPIATFLAACVVVVAIINAPMPTHNPGTHPTYDRGMMPDLFPVPQAVHPSVHPAPTTEPTSVNEEEPEQEQSSQATSTVTVPA